MPIDFKKLNLDFSPPKQWTVLLGEQSPGKKVRWTVVCKQVTEEEAEQARKQTEERLRSAGWMFDSMSLTETTYWIHPEKPQKMILTQRLDR
jgi:hypothetical protein